MAANSASGAILTVRNRELSVILSTTHEVAPPLFAEQVIEVVRVLYSKLLVLYKIGVIAIRIVCSRLLSGTRQCSIISPTHFHFIMFVNAFITQSL